MLVIQVVTIFWTKATRGAPRSLERAALPRAFPIAAGDAKERALCLVQQHRILEEEGFAPKLVGVETRDSFPGTVEALKIVALAGGSFTLGLAAELMSGQPKRRSVPQALTIKPGESARLSVNARHTSYSGQLYTETIYNVACGDAVPSGRFLTPPDHEFDLKAHLF